MVELLFWERPGKLFTKLLHSDAPPVFRFPKLRAISFLRMTEAEMAAPVEIETVEYYRYRNYRPGHERAHYYLDQQ
jgi:hypothetical protein